MNDDRLFKDWCRERDGTVIQGKVDHRSFGTVREWNCHLDDELVIAKTKDGDLSRVVTDDRTYRDVSIDGSDEITLDLGE